MKKRGGNGLLGLKRGSQEVKGDGEDAERFRKAIEGRSDLKFQDLIDHWRRGSDTHNRCQIGSHVKEINAEGEES